MRSSTGGACARAAAEFTEPEIDGQATVYGSNTAVIKGEVVNSNATKQNTIIGSMVEINP
jgi:hypothetical protein